MKVRPWHLLTSHKEGICCGACWGVVVVFNELLVFVRSFAEEEEEESESGEYEDEGADGKRQSMSSSFIYRSPIYIG